MSSTQRTRARRRSRRRSWQHADDDLHRTRKCARRGASVRVPVSRSPRAARLNASVMCVTGSSGDEVAAGGRVDDEEARRRDRRAIADRRSAASASVERRLAVPAGEDVVDRRVAADRAAGSKRHAAGTATWTGRQLRRVGLPDAVGAKSERGRRASRGKNGWQPRPNGNAAAPVFASVELERRASRRAPSARERERLRRAKRPRPRARVVAGGACVERQQRARRVVRGRRATAAASRRRGSRADGRRSCARARASRPRTSSRALGDAVRVRDERIARVRADVARGARGAASGAARRRRRSVNDAMRAARSRRRARRARRPASEQRRRPSGSRRVERPSVGALRRQARPATPRTLPRYSCARPTIMPMSESDRDPRVAVVEIRRDHVRRRADDAAGLAEAAARRGGGRELFLHGGMSDVADDVPSTPTGRPGRRRSSRRRATAAIASSRPSAASVSICTITQTSFVGALQVVGDGAEAAAAMRAGDAAHARPADSASTRRRASPRRRSARTGSSSVCAPASSTRLTITMSFHGGRTIACAGVPATVRRISIICGDVDRHVLHVDDEEVEAGAAERLGRRRRRRS